MKYSDGWWEREWGNIMSSARFEEEVDDDEILIGSLNLLNPKFLWTFHVRL